MDKPKRTPLRDRLRAAAGTAAEAAGFSLRHLPGVGGPLFVSYGLWLAWAPLGFIALGAFLLVADRRIP
ncbi:hypothetical protein [Streptomyces sp. NPDC050988]|uniref:hypothetical protein n=1 Tax=Streptomyces sp. NPDC050988 TaxID=3365637 RepID=UPI00378D7C74